MRCQALLFADEPCSKRICAEPGYERRRSFNVGANLFAMAVFQVTKRWRMCWPLCGQVRSHRICLGFEFG
jgi:hypothetical protein